MKKILYITIMEVPYRTQFFNLLSEKCELTVVYQTSGTITRNKTWAKSVTSKFNYLFLDSTSNKFFKQLKRLLNIIKNGNFDHIIFGCCNEKLQLLTMQLLRITRRKYILNLDGETFFEKKNLKTFFKKILLKGANKYFVAGIESSNNLKKAIKTNRVYPYFFSSLTNEEIEQNSHKKQKRDNYVLVIGKYFDYKGLDVALEAAKLLPNQEFKFLGVGNRSDLFVKKVKEMDLSNIEVIPFLQKEELNLEYQKCKMLVLPSRQECWGLVVNEAASFGTPIVSTFGSGAAVEFLDDKYKMFLAEPGNSKDLAKKISLLLDSKKTQEYSDYLLKKSKQYSIEISVEKHLEEL